ncbi:hypothetical protein Q8W71_29830 [Methylobacterium sp. NEAU 140]|uniref:hypothetical protein n=1 Tax=Methylobacterium sp. NEAU 140 TaxID=3064945 RepID=UPI00273447A4|nr:hypothetical protein [Methylobacterium sp. NEAU 140]MDP4026809.1 hypothetical protein [Methylobacterium sp. NEAU 140]
MVYRIIAERTLKNIPKIVLKTPSRMPPQTTAATIMDACGVSRPNSPLHQTMKSKNASENQLALSGGRLSSGPISSQQGMPLNVAPPPPFVQRGRYAR